MSDCSQFEDLYHANLNAQKALRTIKTMWQDLQATVDAVNTDLQHVDSDVAKRVYTQALSDFQDVEKNWNDVVEFANALAGIDYKWQDTDGNWHNYGEENPTADSGLVTNIAAA